MLLGRSRSSASTRKIQHDCVYNLNWEDIVYRISNDHVLLDLLAHEARREFNLIPLDKCKAAEAWSDAVRNVVSKIFSAEPVVSVLEEQMRSCRGHARSALQTSSDPAVRTHSDERTQRSYDTQQGRLEINNVGVEVLEGSSNAVPEIHCSRVSGSFGSLATQGTEASQTSPKSCIVAIPNDSKDNQHKKRHGNQRMSMRTPDYRSISEDAEVRERDLCPTRPCRQQISEVFHHGQEASADTSGRLIQPIEDGRDVVETTRLWETSGVHSSTKGNQTLQSRAHGNGPAVEEDVVVLKSEQMTSVSRYPAEQRLGSDYARDSPGGEDSTFDLESSRANGAEFGAIEHKSRLTSVGAETQPAKSRAGPKEKSSAESTPSRRVPDTPDCRCSGKEYNEINTEAKGYGRFESKYSSEKDSIVQFSPQGANLTANQTDKHLRGGQRDLLEGANNRETRAGSESRIHLRGARVRFLDESLCSVCEIRPCFEPHELEELFYSTAELDRMYDEMERENVADKKA